MKTFPRLALALVALAGIAAAVDLTNLKPQGYVSDFSGVVDAGSRAQLERYCAAVEQSTGAQIALVTIPTLNEEPVDDVANSLFRKWGIGKKGQDTGILLLLVTNDHRSRLEVGYGLEPILPDGFSGDLLRAMRPALRLNQYGEALMVAAQTIGGRIAKEKQVQIQPLRPQRVVRRHSDGLPWPLVLGGIVVLLVLMASRGGGSGGSFITGMLLGGLLGRGGGGFGGGGGGFGGGDSGGGFGGFGGGDSGGGGASSDW